MGRGRDIGIKAAKWETFIFSCLVVRLKNRLASDVKFPHPVKIALAIKITLIVKFVTVNFWDTNYYLFLAHSSLDTKIYIGGFIGTC